MRIYKNAIILGIILVVIMASFFAIRFFIKEKEDENIGSDKEVAIMEFEADKAVKLSSVSPQEELVFTKVDDEWNIESKKKIKISNDKVKKNINIIASLKSSNVIGKSKDLKQFGLDNPFLLKVELLDNTQKVLEIGNESPVKGNYYVKAEEDNTIYTIPGHIAESLMSAKEEYKDKRLFHSDRESIESLLFVRDGTKVFEIKKLSEFNWIITYPVEIGADINVVQEIVQRIASIDISEFIDESTNDYAQYGLDAPKYVLKISTPEQTANISIGDSIGRDNEAYAISTEYEEVVTINKEKTFFFDLEYEALASKLIASLNINDVDKITVKTEELNVEAEINHDVGNQEKGRFKVNGKDAMVKDDRDKLIFEEFYTSLIRISQTEFDLEAEPDVEPEITIEYFLNKPPNNIKLEFLPYDDEEFYVKRNGKFAGLIVLKEQIYGSKGVLTKYEELKEAIDNQ